MDFGLSDEQQQLKASAREFLANECSTAFVRKLMADPDGMPRDLWNQIAKLGWTGLIVPEEFGGSGLGVLDMAVLLEESGYAAMPGPLMFSVAIATFAITAGGSDDLKRKWLPRLSDGSAIATVAVVESAASIAAADIWTRASRDGAGWTLSGAKLFVPYAHVADLIIVAARAGSADELALFAIETAVGGVKTTMLNNLDLTRRASVLEMDCAAATKLEGGSKLFDRVLDIAAVSVAADSLGGTERALEMAVEYSKVREQFGKPIGSFQALKHAAAEIVADLEPARALLWYAAYAQDWLPVAEGSRAAAMAKVRLSDIYSRASDRAVLMHGGIGFTWEHDMHLWFKRARFNESLYGSPVYHRERLATLSGY
jgi:alkylation response protein AidB-like acyl-CoA dehydrogenase